MLILNSPKQSLGWVEISVLVLRPVGVKLCELEVNMMLSTNCLVLWMEGNSCCRCSTLYILPPVVRSWIMFLILISVAVPQTFASVLAVVVTWIPCTTFLDMYSFTAAAAACTVVVAILHVRVKLLQNSLTSSILCAILAQIRQVSFFLQKILRPINMAVSCMSTTHHFNVFRMFK